MLSESEYLRDRIGGYFFMSVFGLLGLYFIIESGFVKYRPLIGHASGIIVILGTIISFITWMKILSWNNDPKHGEFIKIIIADLQFSP
jgi:hypothetical protein